MRNHRWGKENRLGKESGGMTLEYIILSAFTAIASLTAIGIMKTAIHKQLHQLSEQLDRSFDANEP